MTRKRDRATGRPMNAGDAAKGRCLARAVRTDEAEDFARCDLERQPVHRECRAIVLGQALD